MIRPLAILLAILLVLGAPGGPRVPFAKNAEPALFQQTCDYYRARGGPVRTAGPQEFAAFLADACGAALISLENGTPIQRGHAELLLSRIVLLRKTVEQMNAERAAQERVVRASVRPRVTATGEFLIAHRMGVLIIFDAWLDTGAKFSLASYP
jgi:hypothetical protein